MTNRPKQIGTAGETAVVRAARAHGFGLADRLTLTGALDRGDIGLCPGVILEVKAGQAAKTASDGQIEKWLAETERERTNAHADVAILVTARAGIGAPNAHRWWAHLRFEDLALLIDRGSYTPESLAEQPVRMTLETALLALRHAGYGDPLPPEEP